MTVTERDDIPHTYIVQSGTERYDVDTRDAEWTCSCPSGCWRPERPCRHLIAVSRFKRGLA